MAGVLGNDESIDPLTEDKEEKVRHGAPPNGMMVVNGNNESVSGGNT